MKKILLLICAYTLMSVAWAHASEVVAVVDMQRILKESKAMTSINSQMKKIREEHQVEITKQEEVLRKGEKELTEQRKLLAKKAFAKKEKAFKKKIINIQRDVQEKRAAIDAALNQSIKIVERTIYKVVEEMAAKKKFKVALPSSQTLFVDDSLNITEEVLKKLNSQLPKVNIEKKKD
jgi:Skp family chaperone for outer membrane proteins